MTIQSFFQVSWLQNILLKMRVRNVFFLVRQVFCRVTHSQHVDTHFLVCI
jgi:hypothetical protein